MAIKLAASSTITVPDGDAICVNSHANAGVTASSAPVLLTVNFQNP